LRLDLRAGWRAAPPCDDFSSASSDFSALGAFFWPFVTPSSSRSSAWVVPGQPRTRVPDVVGSRLPRPYHFPARIQSFQAFAAPFPGDSGLPSASRAARRAPGPGGGGVGDPALRHPARSTRPRPRGSGAATGRRLPRRCACGSSRFRSASTHHRCMPRRFSHFEGFQWFAARKIFPLLDFRRMTRVMQATRPQDRRNSRLLKFHRKLEADLCILFMGRFWTGEGR